MKEKVTFEQTITTVNAVPCQCGGGFTTLHSVTKKAFKKEVRIYQCFLCGELRELHKEHYPTIKVKVVDTVESQIGPWPLWAMQACTRVVDAQGIVWYTTYTVDEIMPMVETGSWVIKDESVFDEAKGWVKAGSVVLPQDSDWTKCKFSKE